jgi:hypothetical protein
MVNIHQIRLSVYSYITALVQIVHFFTGSCILHSTFFVQSLKQLDDQVLCENSVEYIYIFWTAEVGSWRKLHKRGVIVCKIYEIYYGLQIEE